MKKPCYCLRLLICALQLTFSAMAQASADHPGQIPDDSQIVEAIRGRHEVNYVEGSHLIVTKILPEDTSGRPHQKWEAKLSNSQIIQVVYNTDMGPTVPLRAGDEFAVGGQFLWLGHNGMIHWVHDDPRKQRPDGYVFFKGVVYGDTDHEDANSH